MAKNIILTIKKVLKNEGLRFTRQRKAVWDELENSNDHHDADRIYENIKAQNLSVSRATVYRTLDVLAKNKFIRKLDVGDGRIRYEAKTTKDHHDHMICLETGNIIEFFDEELKIDKVDYYFTNSISRSSKTMSECREARMKSKI